MATSVAANILHAQPNPISQTIAAWPPLALLLTVDLISRVPVRKGWLAVVRRTATGALAAIAAFVSYGHMVGVVSRYGEVGAVPYLIPLSVDGLVVVASVCLVELNTSAKQADTEADTVTDIAKAPTVRAKGPATSANKTAKAVARLRSRHPDLGTQEIAQRIGVTDRTVRRHLSATTT
ncbi:DUF2637 domain-containing protein [Actinoplanes sp. G11-F43]|uniref:DUF2637 domain-containing protein n=1 Tax=Actinoplanes sp. G11-F43 TaxID=3424130 RepID=UPI003D35482A